MWEPVLHQLIDLCASTTSPLYRIREAWSVEWQSHGESAALNFDKLRADGCSTWLQLIRACSQSCSPAPSHIAIHEYSDVLLDFLQSSHVAGHRVVPVGFSASGTALFVSLHNLVCFAFRSWT